MRSYHIRSTLGLPVVSCVLVSERGSFRVELIFDSGSAFTQIHKTTMEGLGFSFNREPDLKMQGVTGEPDPGHKCILKRLHLLGKKFEQPPVVAINFSKWIKDGIDGLLGWDIIQKMDFEVLGTKKIIKVY